MGSAGFRSRFLKKVNNLSSSLLSVLLFYSAVHRCIVQSCIFSSKAKPVVTRLKIPASSDFCRFPGGVTVAPSSSRPFLRRWPNDSGRPFLTLFVLDAAVVSWRGRVVFAHESYVLFETGPRRRLP